MIDTLMAIWNRGYGGRGILVSLAFLLICISISLLLVTVGNFWTGLWVHHGPPVSRSDTLSASLTATAGSQLKVATPGGTPLVYSPTITPTTNVCVLTPTTGKASHVLSSPTAQHNPGGRSASPTATPRPHPTATATPRPRPTSTPVPTVTPTATPTFTPTATPTSTPTPIPSPTLTPSPSPSPTATVTNTPTPPPATATTTPPAATPTVTPTAGITATATVPPRRRGGTPVPTPAVTATPGHNKIVGRTNCSSPYSGSGDSVDMTYDGSIGAILIRNLWMILGGSTLGTALFYVTIYLLNRKRLMQQETKMTGNESPEE